LKFGTARRATTLRALDAAVREASGHQRRVAFDFSRSIKVAPPALCPDVTYDDLEEIADGTAASTAFWLMASGQADAKMSARLERSLRAYCHSDTSAMVRLHHSLKPSRSARNKREHRAMSWWLVVVRPSITEGHSIHCQRCWNNKLSLIRALT
jgi:hypothetical protein